MLKVKLFSNYYNFLEKVLLLVNYVSFATKIFNIFAGSLESAYSLIWGSHKIWGKGGGDTLDLL